MTIPTYTLGYPPDGSSLGQTKQTIRNNLDGTFLTLAVDHVNNNGQPGMNPAGYHKVIHMVSQASDPPQVSAVGQIYTKSVNSAGNTDTSLFFETGGGGGRKLQLTSNFIPTISANGVTFLTGSASSPMPLIQWGSVTIGSGSSVTGEVTFPRAFTNAVFSIQLQLFGSTGSSNNSLFVTGLNADNVSSFFWRYNGGNSDFSKFYWIAIGN